jgi:two-component system cell cycle response regulator DivK
VRADLPADNRKQVHLTTKPLVLVIDEHEDSRIIVRTIAQHAGLEAVEAAWARAGLDLARERRPSVIVLDLDMRRGQAVEMLAQLRSDDSLRFVPIIALSANSAERIAEAAGCAAFVRKPIGIEPLMRALLHLTRPLDA